MRAWVIDSHIGPDGLDLRSVDPPVPGADEVVVEVFATSLNRADLLQTKGLYPAPSADPEIPGLEVAGRVASVGEGVTSVAPGDRVAGLVAEGGWAELCRVHAGHLIPLPEALPFPQAGGLAETYLTAYDALRLQGGLVEGADVLVHAGGSGIGTAAIQLVRHFGARIAVTCSGAKVEAVSALGPDFVIDHEKDDFVDRVLGWTGGRGVDVILDTVGGDYANRNLRAAATGARIVVIGLLGGAQADVQLGLLLRKRLHLIGSVLRPRPVAEKALLVRRFDHELSGALAQGTLRPVVDSIFELDEIPRGLEHMARNANVGKILVRVRDEAESDA